jgi:hypothetical protein
MTFSNRVQLFAVAIPPVIIRIQQGKVNNRGQTVRPDILFRIEPAELLPKTRRMRAGGWNSRLESRYKTNGEHYMALEFHVGYKAWCVVA